MIGAIAVGTPYVTTSARSVVNTRKLKVIDMKQTVEEAAMNFANYESNILDKLPFKVKNVVDYDNGLTRGFKAGADWQSKQSPWISVEDAIPNELAKGMCQVKYVDGSIDEMAMRKVNKWISPYIKTGYVTYWRPIPSFDGTLKQTKMYYNE